MIGISYENWRDRHFAPDEQLDKDVSGPKAYYAQNTLAKLGYDPGIVDGKFGPKTSGAMKAYETASGLPVTGTITRDLLVRLKDDPIHAG